MRSYIRFVQRNRLYILFEAISISLSFAFILPLVSFWEDKWTIDHGSNYKHIYAICPIGDFETTIGLGQKLYETLPEVEHMPVLKITPSLMGHLFKYQLWLLIQGSTNYFTLD